MAGCKMMQLCALGEDALNSIRRALWGKNGAYVALEVLKAMGIASEVESDTQRRSALGPGVLECPMSKMNKSAAIRQKLCGSGKRRSTR